MRILYLCEKVADFFCQTLRYSVANKNLQEDFFRIRISAFRILALNTIVFAVNKQMRDLPQA